MFERVKRFTREVRVHQQKSIDELLAARRDLEQLRAEIATVRHQLAGMKDTINTLSRRDHHTDRIRVLFLIHYMEAWDSLADIYTGMENADDFEPIVASIPRRLVGATEYTDEDTTHQRLQTLGIPHIRLDADPASLHWIKHLDPDLIFRQSQWDADIPPIYSTINLDFTRLALVPYATGNLTRLQDSSPQSLNRRFGYHRNCWAVFCASDAERSHAFSVGWPGADRYVPTGHPKVDRLRVPDDPAPRPFTVMWSAHHSLGDRWTSFGRFHLDALDMVDWARSRPDLRFVFSPHPSLSSRLAHPEPPLTAEFVDEFWAGWESLPNTETFRSAESGAYTDLFATSDVCVTDGLSMLLEYQVNTKPVIFLERTGHSPFTPMGQIAARGFHTVHSVPEAVSLVDGFAAGQPDPLAEAQAEVVAELLGDGGAAGRILDYIRAHWREPHPSSGLLS